MLTILTALALVAAVDAGASTDDKTIHTCGWEVGGWEVGGWEVGEQCQDAKGVIWTWDGNTWSNPDGQPGTTLTRITLIDTLGNNEGCP